MSAAPQLDDWNAEKDSPEIPFEIVLHGPSSARGKLRVGPTGEDDPERARYVDQVIERIRAAKENRE